MLFEISKSHRTQHFFGLSSVKLYALTLIIYFFYFILSTCIVWENVSKWRFNHLVAYIKSSFCIKEYLKKNILTCNVIIYFLLIQLCYSKRDNGSDSQHLQRAIDPHYPHHLCLDCCSSDLCNQKGCGQKGSLSQFSRAKKICVVNESSCITRRKPVFGPLLLYQHVSGSDLVGNKSLSRTSLSNVKRENELPKTKVRFLLTNTYFWNITSIHV